MGVLFVGGGLLVSRLVGLLLWNLNIVWFGLLVIRVSLVFVVSIWIRCVVCGLSCWVLLIKRVWIWVCLVVSNLGLIVKVFKVVFISLVVFSVGVVVCGVVSFIVFCNNIICLYCWVN